jgi:Zn-dependent metalloprotease
MVDPKASHCLSPQPDTYDNFDPSADVHENSGIPNHAFALFARAVGGNAYDAPIKVWYAACTNGRLFLGGDHC